MGVSGAWSDAWTQLQEMVHDFMGALPRVGLAIIIFVLFYLAARWIKVVVKRVAQAADMSSGAEMVLGRLARWLTIGLGLFVALTVAVESFTPGQFIQFLGIGSVAIGFAFHDILQNFLAGILLLLTEPFRIGDQIIVNQFEGTVENIETRATTIKTYDNRRVVIPNSHLFTESVTVNTAFPVRRSEYEVGIGCSDDIGLAMSLLVDAMRSVEGVLETPAPDVLVSDLGDFSVKIRARWWTDSLRANVLTVQSDVIAEIKARLLAHGVDLPFPTQHVLFHDQTDETDGDRACQREGWPAGHGPIPEADGIGRAIDRLRATLLNREKA
ncbi:MAG: mechanosensitive ion channel family protein [Anaerolineae bacterium]|jgi:small-conductance mechanosensitive channel